MNSFIHDLNQTNFTNYKPDDVPEALDLREQLALNRLKDILKIPKKKRTFENTVLGFTRMADEFMQVVSLVTHLESVLGEEWRKADTLATEKATNFFADISQDKRIYEALKVIDSTDIVRQNNEKRLLKEMLVDYEVGGILLPTDKKNRMKQIKLKLAALSTEFGQNTTATDNKAGVLLKSKSELKGLKQETIEICKTEAEKLGMDGYWLKYSPPLSVVVMANAKVKSTRDSYFKMSVTKNNGRNAEIAKEILELRKELATMLGYKNFADLNLVQRMAKNGKVAYEFITELRVHYQERSVIEHTELEAFARKYEGDESFVLPLYESITGLDLFYAQKLKKELFDIDEDSLADYFEISNVLNAMFKTLTSLYGVSFVEDPSIDTWHEDVKVYRIYNEKDENIAIVHCDWYYREGKHPGAWMNELYVASRKKGKVTEPHQGLVIGNLPTPTKTKPALLTLRDIETIWHEFGHFMHLAFNATELEEQSMMSTKWDFVEAPSQIMENFIWEPAIMSQYAIHYKTGKALSTEVITNLKKVRNFRASSKAMRQFIFSETDLGLHMHFDPSGGQSVEEYYRNYRNKLTPVPTAEFDSGILSFLHIFSGGYAAGYYSYKWAEAIQADFYTRFHEEGPLNPKTGRHYIKSVLSRGNEVDPEVLIQEFLGREHSIEAMLINDGVKTNLSK